jgi:hypothetical protein
MCNPKFPKPALITDLQCERLAAFLSHFQTSHNPICYLPNIIQNFLVAFHLAAFSKNDFRVP